MITIWEGTLHRRALVGALLPFVVAACSTARDATAPSSTTNGPDVAAISAVNGAIDASAAVGAPFTFDASALAFAGLRGTRLIFSATFLPSANGLMFSAGRIAGTPLASGTFVVAVTAKDATGHSATRTVNIVVRDNAQPITVASGNTAQGAVVGATFNYDACKNNTVFVGGSSALTYTITFSPTDNGLVAVGSRIVGAPTSTGIVTATVVARDASGQSATNAFPIVAFANDLVSPTFTTAFNYSDATSPLPGYFSNVGAQGLAASTTDNTPATNPISNAGATLGRVLFHDRRLSINDRVSCSSCHQQQFGFGDTAQLSAGFAGGLTGRHSMSLSNARYYQRGHFFWDERANALEDQVLQPIQNSVEMGMTLPDLLTKIQATSYYAPLFESAFGTSDINTDRVSRALAQYVRSIVSAGARYDRAFTGGPPNFPAVLTALELQGLQVFNGPGGCVRCHTSEAFIADNIHNTGLDATVTDVGAGVGRFKVPSLRNVAIRGRFMHDGRFTSLEQVVEFYNSGVQNNPNLDQRLRQGNQPQRLNLTGAQKSALVAFLGTLTDSTLIANPKFASPFAR